MINFYRISRNKKFIITHLWESNWLKNVKLINLWSPTLEWSIVITHLEVINLESPIFKWLMYDHISLGCLLIIINLQTFIFPFMYKWFINLYAPWFIMMWLVPGLANSNHDPNHTFISFFNKVVIAFATFCCPNIYTFHILLLCPPLTFLPGIFTHGIHFLCIFHIILMNNL